MKLSKNNLTVELGRTLLALWQDSPDNPPEGVVERILYLSEVFDLNKSDYVVVVASRKITIPQRFEGGWPVTQYVVTYSEVSLDYLISFLGEMRRGCWDVDGITSFPKGESYDRTVIMSSEGHEDYVECL
jgi:hypothetical protein